MNVDERKRGIKAKRQRNNDISSKISSLNINWPFPKEG